MKLVVATNNQHKLKEFKSILKDEFDEILSLKDLNINIEIEENGETFEENSLIKLKEIMKLVKNFSIIADDSGLCVDSLNGAPGVYTSRYAGETATSTENMQLLLKNLENCENRKANFKACLSYYNALNDKIYTVTGEVFGEITKELKGINGFGYDPIFYSYELGKTFANSSDDEKNSVSHRGKALKNLLNLIRNIK